MMKKQHELPKGLFRGKNALVIHVGDSIEIANLIVRFLNDRGCGDKEDVAGFWRGARAYGKGFAIKVDRDDGEMGFANMNYYADEQDSCTFYDSVAEFIQAFEKPCEPEDGVAAIDQYGCAMLQGYLEETLRILNDNNGLKSVTMRWGRIIDIAEQLLACLKS